MGYGATFRTESQTKPNYFLIWNNGTYGGKSKTCAHMHPTHHMTLVHTNISTGQSCDNDFIFRL
jgi:hypothetical protein